MKKIFLIFTAIILFASCSQIPQKQNQDLDVDLINNYSSNLSLKLGFCPTMEKDALALQENNQNLELVRFGSAGEVLQNIKSEKIDLALIGRKAKRMEIMENIIERNLETEKKYTLINEQKEMIEEKGLTNLSVQTCLDQSVKNHFPELNLSFEQTCNYANGEVWLISWAEFTDEMELLIPVNTKGEKIRKFRNAYLYGKNFNNLNF